WGGDAYLWGVLGFFPPFWVVGFGGGGRGGFFTRAKFRLCACSRGAGRERPPYHVAPRAAQCHGSDLDVYAVYTCRIGHGLNFARLSWHWSASWFAFIGRAAGAGQSESPGSLAWTHWLLRHCAPAQLADLYWRSGARCARSTETLCRCCRACSDGSGARHRAGCPHARGAAV